MCGIAAVCDRMRNNAVVATVATVLALVAGLLWWTDMTWTGYKSYVDIRGAGYRAAHIPLADWINETGQPGDTIALMDIGIVGFKCIDFNVLDITGLTDRTIAKSPGGFLTKEFDPAYVYDRQPEFFILTIKAPPGLITPENVGELFAWTEIEHRLFTRPEFAAHYVRRRESRAGASELEWLADVFGAERVYRHNYPGKGYLLFAYRWHHAPASQPADEDRTQ